MDLGFAVYSFVALFLIVDPIANVPIFLGFLGPFEPEVRGRMVKTAVLMAALVLLFFTVAGTYVFRYLGIEIYSFQIAGGILLFIIAIEMLFGERSRTTRTPEEEMRRGEEAVFTPLAVPLLTGPGAITLGIVLFNSATSLPNRAVLILNIALVYSMTYLILSRAGALYQLLGSAGTKVVTRIMGLLLSAIAVQFVVAGIKEAARTIALG